METLETEKKDGRTTALTRFFGTCSGAHGDITHLLLEVSLLQDQSRQHDAWHSGDTRYVITVVEVFHG